MLQDPALEGDIFSFDDDPEIPVKFVIGRIELEEVSMFDLENDRRFDGLYIQQAGLFSVETGEVGGPVIFGSKLDIVFLPGLVYCIQFKTTGNDEGEMTANLTWLKD